jgi:hypothetical protein
MQLPAVVPQGLGVALPAVAPLPAIARPAAGSPAAPPKAVPLIAKGAGLGGPGIPAALPANGAGAEPAVLGQRRPPVEPVIAAVAPSEPPPRKEPAKIEEWQPSPNFRRQGPSVLRWAFLSLALVAFALAALLFIFTQAPVPGLDVLRSLGLPVKESPSAAPEPSLSPTTAPSASPSASGAPLSTAVPAPPPAPPPATASASVAPTATASAKASATVKASSPKPVVVKTGEPVKPIKKPSSVFDAPLDLGKEKEKDKDE